MLTSRIDIENVVALNVEGGDGAVKRIFKAWDERYDEEEVHSEPDHHAANRYSFACTVLTINA